jgi:CheY-like chemotaxis protein
MNQTKLSICKYPLTTILLDDSETFLSQISFNLSRQNIICCPFTEPTAALNYLNNEYVADPFTNRCINTVADRNTDTFELRFDFRKIHHEIYNPRRFSQIGVLTVDYAMPTMNGLEFCRKVNDEFCQKILLTGEAGSSLVIDAFNLNSPWLATVH